MAGKGYFGQNNAASSTSGFSERDFHIQQSQKLMSTATLVQVKKYKPREKDSKGKAGEVQPIGYLDVLPLVNMVDGSGKPVKHQVVHNMPYFRSQSGKQAIIMDPQDGDIGLVVFADRDISAVKKNLKQSNPGSKRRNDFADGVFVGVVASKDKPTSYIQFDNNGTITISPDEGKTFFSIKKDEIRMHANGIAVYVTPNRIDLGKKNAPHAVVTVDGPSEKVFAVINESDSN